MGALPVVFQRSDALHPGRSLCDLSHKHLYTASMGQLIPIDVLDCVPGDVVSLGIEAVIRFQPMVAPILHQIDYKVYSFFVPYRILEPGIEVLWTGGESGSETFTPNRWTTFESTAVGSLYDYFGFQPGTFPTGVAPLKLPLEAYNLIWNEYFRDENLQGPVVIADNADVLNVDWSKDYFTSALPWQQKGTAPALPISGTSSAVWDYSTFRHIPGTANMDNLVASSASISSTIGVVNTSGDLTSWQNLYQAFNDNSVDFSEATTFDVADIRTAFAVQRLLERSARGGSRYTEWLRSVMGVAPRDERLQRPEYIGGHSNPVIISEVLQTSESATTPQGTMAGHGLGITDGYIGKYRCQEYGCIMTVAVVKPKPAYMTGNPRQWLKPTKYDWYYPQFVNMSEQAVLNSELYVSTDSPTNQGIFGYQGRYNEMRYRPDMVTGLMRTDFDYWHLARSFASSPALNADFIELKPIETTRIFAVEDPDATPGLIISAGIQCKAIRPIPITPMPGLLDHI